MSHDELQAANIFSILDEIHDEIDTFIVDEDPYDAGVVEMQAEIYCRAFRNHARTHDVVAERADLIELAAILVARIDAIDAREDEE